MAYADFTGDNSTEAEGRIVPDEMRCYKLSTSTTADNLPLPRDVKTVTLYSTKAHWIRVDKVSSAATADLSDTTKDNVIYVPAGTFVIAQNQEFNCITAKTAADTDTLYVYPGSAKVVNGLVSEDLAS